MKLIILKNNLREGLSAVERGVSEGTHLPILKNVLIKTKDSKIKLSTTNLELGVTKFISGKIQEEGGITIPFATLYHLVSALNSEKINIDTKQSNVIITTDNYEAKIQGLQEDDYPIIPHLENVSQYIEFSADFFKQAVGQVITAAHISEIRPEISGILIDYQTSIVKLAATDSFRLAEKTIFNTQFTSTISTNFKAIVPLKTMQEVLRVFANDQPLKLSIDANQILFKNNDVELISRLIDGTYPDYEQIIPKSFESELVLEREHFVNALKLVSNFSGKVNDIRLKIQPDQKVLEVYSQNQFLGENNYLIPSKITGAPFSDVSFNWRYLLDGLRVVTSPTLLFAVNSNNRPALLKTPDDTSYFYILMPIKF